MPSPTSAHVPGVKVGWGVVVVVEVDVVLVDLIFLIVVRTMVGITSVTVRVRWPPAPPVRVSVVVKEVVYLLTARLSYKKNMDQCQGAIQFHHTHKGFWHGRSKLCHESETAQADAKESDHLEEGMKITVAASDGEACQLLAARVGRKLKEDIHLFMF